ncbi:hypothetical protein LW347_10165 [Pectobacterium polonicum]|uniref:Uncharacterized protein n=1 Tax=Pectobacterium polonicum TaxID=2485124 RepID=A0AAE9NUX5_9GAMM|nr:hypothetical protein [Pectobacterium polonicum]UVO10270.1 hypothetical protein LW347_10165 [Pectobacterium polonicum]
MLNQRLKAQNVAILIVLNAIYYGEEKQKAITRYRMARKSFMLLARRKALHVTFVADVAQELQELGWQLIEDGSGNFCFFDIGITANWARLSTKRVKALRDYEDSELVKLLEANLGIEDVEESDE